MKSVSPNALGGISRLDYLIFTYTFGRTELARRKASLIACCVVESFAVVKDIDANTLRVIIPSENSFGQERGKVMERDQ